MKNLFRLLAVAALATTFALPAFAQAATQTPAPAASGPCTEADAKAALYNRFRENFKGTPDQQKAAYEAGREYLTKYGNCPDEGDKQIAAYVQNWVGKYEKATVEFNCTKAANENPAQAFEACRQWIAASPDNLRPHLALVAAGIKSYSNKDNSLNTRAAAEARTALQLIESGKTTDTWAPFANQQDAPAGLRYYIAAWSFDSNPEEAATQLIKVAQSNSAFAKEPATYQLLAAAYYNGEYKKLAAEYKEKYEGKEETPESTALYNRINAVTDRIIDAYARAVALSNGKAPYAALNSQAKTALTTFYKQRHEGSEAGLNELVSNVLSRPIMLPGQEPAPTQAPSSTSGTNGDGVKAAPGNGPTTTTPASTTTTAKPAPATGTNAKPASTPKPPRK